MKYFENILLQKLVIYSQPEVRSNMIKKIVQAVLQRLLGFEKYLFVFARTVKITLPWNPNEKDVLHFIKMMPKDAQVIDVGANLGVMTVWAAQSCPEGKVYAFEPIPENYRVLNRMVQSYKLTNVATYNIALGAEEGPIEMKMPVMNGVKMQGLSHVQHPSVDSYDTEFLTYRLFQMKLDNIPDFAERRISGIKLDVENYEQFVLKGAVALLKRSLPIVYTELWDNENRKAVFELLGELGYVAHVLDKGVVRPFEKSTDSQHNFFFIPEE